MHQVSTILTAAGPVVACASGQATDVPGPAPIRCRLSARARDHLRARWLTLRLSLRFQSAAGTDSTVSRAVVIPRQAF